MSIPHRLAEKRSFWYIPYVSRPTYHLILHTPYVYYPICISHIYIPYRLAETRRVERHRCTVDQAKAYFLSKEPYIQAKEPCIQLKEPWIQSKELNVLSKEPYILSEGANLWVNRALHSCVSMYVHVCIHKVQKLKITYESGPGKRALQSGKRAL